jgi:oligopeptide transport system permease protein
MRRKTEIFSLIFLLALILSSVVAGLAPEEAPQVDRVLEAASMQHWLGTDSLGRDLFHQSLLASGWTLGLALSAAVLALTMGVVVGGHLGFRGGKIDFISMRILDVLEGVPNFIFSILLIYIFNFLSTKVGLSTASIVFETLPLILSLGVVTSISAIRLMRNLFAFQKTQTYVEGAKAIGSSDWRVISKHILPNIKKQIFNSFLGRISGLILLEAYISLLGFGLQSSHITWGRQLVEAWRYQAASLWVVIAPLIFLVLTLLALSSLRRHSR